MEVQPLGNYILVESTSEARFKCKDEKGVIVVPDTAKPQETTHVTRKVLKVGKNVQIINPGDYVVFPGIINQQTNRPAVILERIENDKETLDMMAEANVLYALTEE